MFNNTNFRDFLLVFADMRIGKWKHNRNNRCRYVELIIDMKNGDCIIKDEDGIYIDIKMLKHQDEVKT